MELVSRIKDIALRRHVQCQYSWPAFLRAQIRGRKHPSCCVLGRESSGI